MFIPFVSQRKRDTNALFRRKGGGGKGGGGSSSGGGSASGAGRGSSGVSTSSGSKSATPYGFGGGRASTIPTGSLFAGRSQGGGNRNQIYGTRNYGSGYPGYAGRGVGGLGFPFFFWPIAWGGVGFGAASYLHTSEYGLPDNTSRPGGPMMYATFNSSLGNSANSTIFHVVADNSTVSSLIIDITANCTFDESTSSTSPVTYTGTDPNIQPESTVQYFRASSVALTLQGYNNTGALSDQADTPDTPLPTAIDTELLICLNDTIGLAAPLIDGAAPFASLPQLFPILFVFWYFIALI